ncbi:hypothetical protein ACFL0H_06170 [Thermodesulfobacteriota bacterium]
MVRYDRIIPPGGEGKISLKIKTKGLSGNIRKKAKVYTNDPKNRLVTLTVEAFIKVPVQIFPGRVYLYGDEGQIISKSLKITAKEEEPLKLEPDHFNLTEKVAYQIEVVEPGKIFIIKFRNIHTLAGTSKGILKLKTNYPEKPEISIPITLKLRKKRIKKDMDSSKVPGSHKP